MKLIPYLHFAVPNLYLSNGYIQEDSEYGTLTSYLDEDGLEECVRKVLIRIPKRLTGRQLRFLRRGLSLSQKEFGQLIEASEQTVARIEKKNDQISRYVDLTIRTSYFNKYKPQTSINEISAIIDEISAFHQDKIILSCVHGKWDFKYHVPLKYSERIEKLAASSVLHEKNIFIVNNFSMTNSMTNSNFENNELSNLKIKPKFETTTQWTHV